MLSARAPAEDIPPDPSTMVRIGRIASVDLAAGTCRVAFGDPDDADGEVETADVRWLAARVGQISVWLPPSVGEQVVFLCPDGDLAQAVPIGAIPSQDNPPAGNSKCALIRFADGAVLAYDPESHHADIALPGGASMAIAADGGLSITGDVAITGNVTVTGTLTADQDVLGGGKSLKTHLHTSVQAGAAQSGPPA